MPKAKDLITDYWAKAIYTIIMLVVVGLGTFVYKNSVRGAEEAKAATARVRAVEQNIKQMTENTKQMVDYAKEMSEAIKALSDISIEYGKELEFGNEHHSIINKRLERLEK